MRSLSESGRTNKTLYNNYTLRKYCSIYVCTVINDEIVQHSTRLVPARPNNTALGFAS